MLLTTPNNAQLARLLAAEDAITQAVAALGTRHGLESESAALLAARPTSHRDALPLLIWLLEVTAFLGAAAARPAKR
jgi:hypothetical protein